MRRWPAAMASAPTPAPHGSRSSSAWPRPTRGWARAPTGSAASTRPVPLARLTPWPRCPDAAPWWISQPRGRQGRGELQGGDREERTAHAHGEGDGQGRGQGGGDMGMSIFCGGLFPMYEVFLGSSSVWIEGARAGRLLTDITKHCVFSPPKPNDPPIGPMIGMTMPPASITTKVGGVPMPSLTN